jgi:hypothetical protein
VRWFACLLLITVWLLAVITGRDLGGAAHLLAAGAVVIVLASGKRLRRVAVRRRLGRLAPR